MLNIKELLLRQINEYDQRAAECCAQIVETRLANQSEPDDDYARMATGIASAPRLRGEEALRHFGVVSGLLEVENEGD